MMELFDFETIAVNKRGEKTKKQVKSMKFGTNPMIWGGIGLFLFGFFAFLAAINPGLWKSAWWIIPLLEIIPVLRGYAFWKARRKLLNEKVGSATGTITYNSSTGYYAGETDDGRSVSSLLLRNLPPGKYRFYYLENEDWWLSAEPLSSEAEMLSNLNDTLASAFGYEREHLEYCQRQAGVAQLKTAEGLLKLNLESNNDDSPPTPVSFTVGQVTFALPQKGSYVLLEKLPYRVYYREGEEQGLIKQIADLVNSQEMNFEAIEAV